MITNPNVEDIHRLTELQETMLMHRLQRQEADSGILLVRATLVGELDVDRFRAAWEATLAGHPAARSSVHWQALKHPVQVVARDVAVDIELADWSSLPVEQQQERLAEREQRERGRGLDVGTAPVMRWSLARTAEREHHLLWVCHHLLLDGWSSALLLDEVIERYDALAQDRPLAAAAAPRFRDWVTWLRRHDDVDPAELWAKQGFRLATPIAMNGWHEHTMQGRQEVVETLATFSQHDLDATARNWQLSPASLYLGCWGLTLAETTGSMEAVFGFTASGRSVNFDGIERLVGMLANTLPFTVQVEGSAPASDWFRHVAANQHDVQRFERCSLGALLRAGGYVAHRPLFDTLLTVANYPGLGAPHDRTAPARVLALQDFDSDVMSGYPLTLAIVPGAELRLRAVYQPEAVGRSTAEAMLARFERIVRHVVSDAAATVGDLLVAAPGNQGQVLATTRSKPKRTASPATADAPISAVERQLVHIWLALLDVPDVGLNETFFALGGNSILVPAMIERVQQDFGVELPLGAVFEAPTVRALAKIIESGAPGRAWHCVVPIRESGKRPPLYLMHYLEGSIGHYYNLANRLPHDQPVFGVQAPSEPLTSIEGMAARYLEEIRARQPQGPYRLGGFCIGGMLAFEMARQLSTQGESVPPLMLLDCVAPGPLFAMSNTVLPSKLTLARMALADPLVFADRVAKRLVRSAKRLSRSGEGREAPVELSDVRDLSTLPQAFLEPSMCHFRAGRDYRPDPWDGDAILLRTDDERFGGDLGWRPFIKGRLDITFIPGSHVDTLQEPTVKETGRLLAAALDQATPALRPRESRPRRTG